MFKMCLFGGNGDHANNNFAAGGFFNNNSNRSLAELNAHDQNLVSFNDSSSMVKHTGLVTPDVGFSVGVDNQHGEELGAKEIVASRKAYKNERNSNLSKRPWTAKDDGELIHLVKIYGVKKWSYIAMLMKTRNGKQCRERWINHLDHEIKKEDWTEADDKILIQAHREVGNKWSKIAKKLPGRPENDVKNHWYTVKRRANSGRNSTLYNYIRGLNMDLTPNNYVEESSALETTTNAVTPDPGLNPSTQSENMVSSPNDWLLQNVEDLFWMDYELE